MVERFLTYMGYTVSHNKLWYYSSLAVSCVFLAIGVYDTVTADNLMQSNSSTVLSNLPIIIIPLLFAIGLIIIFLVFSVIDHHNDSAVKVLLRFSMLVCAVILTIVATYSGVTGAVRLVSVSLSISGPIMVIIGLIWMRLR